MGGPLVFGVPGSYARRNSLLHPPYDKATNGVLGSAPSGISVNYVSGRLVEAETDTCATWPIQQSSIITDEWFSYTARGETSDFYQSTPNSGGYFHSAATYWANGVLASLNGYSGSTLNYSASWNLDGEGRVSSNGFLSSTTYNPAGQPTQLNLSSGDSDSFTYDPKTGRMTQYQYTVNNQSVVGNLTWNANGTLAQLNITDPFNSANQQNCSYSHDDLTRIASANCGANASQTYTYDPFGNISVNGFYSYLPIYSPSGTNQVSSVGSCTATYDAAGQPTNDCINTYSWDAYGHPTTISGNGVTYDALGRMVEVNVAGAYYTQRMFSPTGFLMEIPSLGKKFVPLPGGNQVVYLPSAPGGYFYRHVDWLGSSRFASTPSRTMYYDGAYTPFGRPYYFTGSGAGTYDYSFTGQEATFPNSNDFPARQYSIAGRWPSPDPSGLASVHLADPQSLNRYAYVRNNPLANVDPNGLDCGVGPDDACSDDGGSGGGVSGIGGGGGGGGFDPTSGGDQNNSGGDVCGIGQLCTNGGGDLITSMDQNDLTAWVTASLSADNPTVETQDSPLGTTLLQDCGGCILGQMANDPQSMAILNSASDWVTAATIYEGVGVTSVFGAGAVASLEWVDVAVGYGESGGSPLFHTAVGVDGQWMSAWGEFGNMTMESGSEFWVEKYSWFKFPFPVMNSQAVLATEGATASMCISGVCQAIWNGWVH